MTYLDRIPQDVVIRREWACGCVLMGDGRQDLCSKHPTSPDGELTPIGTSPKPGQRWKHEDSRDCPNPKPDDSFTYPESRVEWLCPGHTA